VVVFTEKAQIFSIGGRVEIHPPFSRLAGVAGSGLGGLVWLPLRADGSGGAGSLGLEKDGESSIGIGQE
jgi:hypothetical protein